MSAMQAVSWTVAGAAAAYVGLEWRRFGARSSIAIVLALGICNAAAQLK